CDGITATHTDNLDVNNPLVPFAPEELDLKCNCSNYPQCLTVGTKDLNNIDEKLTVYPNPTSGKTTITLNSSKEDPETLYLYDGLGTLILTKNIKSLPQIDIDLKGYAPGLYYGIIFGKNRIEKSFTIAVE